MSSRRTEHNWISLRAARCYCDARLPAHELIKRCGCGMEDCLIRLGDETTWHYRGKHWYALCAFYDALRYVESGQVTVNV